MSLWKKEMVTMEMVNRTMQDAAEDKLKARYIRRVSNSQEQVKQPPWMTKEIRQEIKKRKDKNRIKRNAQSQEV